MYDTGVGVHAGACHTQRIMDLKRNKEEGHTISVMYTIHFWLLENPLLISQTEIKSKMDQYINHHSEDGQ